VSWGVVSFRNASAALAIESLSWSALAFSWAVGSLLLLQAKSKTAKGSKISFFILGFIAVFAGAGGNVIHVSKAVALWQVDMGHADIF
jgi:hypothetical protein